ncbi:alpha-E domain-containing protein [Bengtsoniella intestinalis]|uniref:alpha-E domain-containing protein n=1 Tax=Bengtsoniella intestinalis TaxID=3073143 RepID=UPI00391F2B5E
MGSVSLSKNNRLFWLGRYAERVYQGVMIIRAIQDELIDGDKVDMVDLKNRLGMEYAFASVEEFFQSYAYDITLSDSIYYSADQMLGNGMVLREVLGSQTLSYLQMAMSALEQAKESNSCGLQLQWVMDDIMAFRGCYGEYIEEESTRNTIRCGASVERVVTMIRFGAEEGSLKKEILKLINRLYKTKLSFDQAQLEVINGFAFSEEGNKDVLLSSVEALFQI